MAREHVQLVHGPNCGCIVHRHERSEDSVGTATGARPAVITSVVSASKLVGHSLAAALRAVSKPTDFGTTLCCFNAQLCCFNAHGLAGN